MNSVLRLVLPSRFWNIDRHMPELCMQNGGGLTRNRFVF